MADDELEMPRLGRPPRKSREQVKREWRPPALLPDPTPEPGYRYRWISVSIMGEDNPMNISTKLREGWEPVKASDHPEVHVEASAEGRFKDNIIIGGLMLCKIPEEMAEARDEYFRRQSKSQMQSVDNTFMSQNDPRMPLFKEHSTEVKFGKGKS